MGNQETTHRPEGMSAQEQKQIVREGYDRLSCDYRSDSTPDDHEQYAQWIQLLVDQHPHGGAVLDIGCGCGLPATKLLAEHFHVIGVDFSEVQIDRAKKLVPFAQFLCRDISELTFPPQSFDAIVSFYAIIHMPIEEHPTLFASIARWLKPGGLFLATIGHTAWTGTDNAYLDVSGGKMAWSHADEATNIRWLTQAGLQVQWTRFVPEGDSGHTLVLAQKVGNS
jgi:2-polyprenyl-3-methyl-5-hydroxy-6-metoxy-1,4-benzoquinol methylase